MPSSLIALFLKGGLRQPARTSYAKWTWPKPSSSLVVSYTYLFFLTLTKFKSLFPAHDPPQVRQTFNLLKRIVFCVNSVFVFVCCFGFLVTMKPFVKDSPVPLAS